ncbi:hypothetical protein [Streptomyces sp. NPDC047043]|uniref:hypothetical protein n=1 Tax=Streptomyces sp. NPDC047043 TaxID=3154497 RepID=UPI0033E3A3F8
MDREQFAVRPERDVCGVDVRREAPCPQRGGVGRVGDVQLLSCSPAVGRVFFVFVSGESSVMSVLPSGENASSWEVVLI